MVPLCMWLSSSILCRVSVQWMSVNMGKNGMTTLYCLSFRWILPLSFAVNSILVAGSLIHAAASVSLSSRTSPWLQSLKINQIFRGGETMVSNESSTFWKVLTRSLMGVLGLMVDSRCQGPSVVVFA